MRKKRILEALKIVAIIVSAVILGYIVSVWKINKDILNLDKAVKDPSAFGYYGILEIGDMKRDLYRATYEESQKEIDKDRVVMVSSEFGGEKPDIVFIAGHNKFNLMKELKEASEKSENVIIRTNFGVYEYDIVKKGIRETGETKEMGARILSENGKNDIIDELYETGSDSFIYTCWPQVTSKDRYVLFMKQKEKRNEKE